MEKIHITKQAIRQIDKVSRICETETGGVLVGTRKRPAVLFAGDPGPKARLHPASYSSDPEHDEELLEDAQKQYDGRVGLLGYWHKHPSGLNRPSDGDFSQARELLSALDDKPLPWLLVFIVDPAHPRGQNIFPYVLISSENEFRPLELTVVEEEDTDVRKALQAESLHVLPRDSRNFWNNPEFRFHLTPTGAQRLRQEKQQLEAAGYQVQIRQRKENRRVALTINGEDDSWLCVPPREYPLSMPRIFRLPDLDEESPFREYLVWNSDLTLTDCLTALKHQQAVPESKPKPEPKLETIPMKESLARPVEVPPMPLVFASPPHQSPVSLVWLPATILCLCGLMIVRIFR